MSATAFQNACGEIVTVTRYDDGRMGVDYPGLTLLSQTGMLIPGNLLEVEGQRYTLPAHEALSIQRAIEQLSPAEAAPPSNGRVTRWTPTPAASYRAKPGSPSITIHCGTRPRH